MTRRLLLPGAPVPTDRYPTNQPDEDPDEPLDDMSPWDEEEGAMEAEAHYLRAMGWGDHT